LKTRTNVELSIADLKEIFDFIAEDSIRYATITSNTIYQRVQPIMDNPLIGRIVPEFNRKLVKELIVGNYRIIFRIKSDAQVDILRIYHTGRLLKGGTLK